MGVTFNFGEFAASRTICGDTLQEMGTRNEKIYVMTADLMRTCSVKGCKASFPKRFINVGIAEQNMFGMAAGLALEGNIPYITTMATFASMRACEQLRTDICYQNLPVRIVATNAGLTSTGGATHNAMEDMGVLRSMANLTIIVPGDPNIAKDILLATENHPGPVYIRLARGKGEPIVYQPGEVDYQVGKAIETRQGKDAVIIACGVMVSQAVDTANILEKEGMSVAVLDMHTIKPIDEEAVKKAARNTGVILTLEDHYTIGGLGSAVAEVIADWNLDCKFKRMGIPQLFPGFGDGPELYDKYGFGLDGTVNTLRDMIRNS